MKKFVVTVDRTSFYDVMTDDPERAIDLVLGTDDPKPGETVEESGQETTDHSVEYA